MSDQDQEREASAEIELTPDMVYAGEERYCDLDYEGVDPEYIVTEVYIAMETMRLRQIADDSRQSEKG